MSLENAPQDAPLTDVVERTPSLRRAYVLFMDMIGFSRLKTGQQVAAQKELSRIVQEMPEVVAARADTDSFIARPTGDGMALLFFKDLLSPLRCALQIHQHFKYNAAELKQNIGVDIKLRMGVHAGEVTLVEDMNRNMDAAGEGIITAQRVMDLGDEDHILLSNEVAKVLKGIEPWANYLTDLGEVRVKHKVVVHVFNLYGRLDGPFCGNPSKPKSVAEDSRNRAKEARAQRPSLGDMLLPYKKPIATVLVLGGIGYGGYAYNQSTKGGLVKMVQSTIAALTPKPEKPKKPTPKPRGGNGPRGGGGGRPSGGGGGGYSSGGGSVSNKISVPRVVGDDASAAEQALSDFHVVRVEVDSSKPAEQVVKQSPSSGSKVSPGSTVKIWVSKGADDNGPEPTPEPTEATPDPGEQTGGASSNSENGNE